MFEIDKVQHRKIAISKRRKIYEALHHEEYAKRITHFFHEWISGQKPVCVVALYHPIMVIGHYGISVPDNDQTLIPDLIICPLLAYDSKGMRLGYGGGFYDRTIKYFRKNKQVKYIGLAFSGQKSYHDLPSEVHDVPLDAVLTETGMDYFQ